MDDMNDTLEPTASGSRRGEKSETAFRTISEVATLLDLPQHVLRFWETKFTQVSPMKRGGGRRYYRPEDVDVLRAIRTLLHDEGYTIKGVQKLLRKGDAKASLATATATADKAAPETTAPTTAPQPTGATMAPTDQLSASPRLDAAEMADLVQELEAARDILKKAAC